MGRVTTATMLAIGLGVVLAGGALAQDAATTPGGKAVLARQAHYKELSKAVSALGGELRKDAPDKAAVTAGSSAINALAQALPTWFPKGSGPEAGVKTAAKAEIWTDAAGFDKAVGKLQAETAKLGDLGQAGDIDGVRTQMRALFAACKNCHDQYRMPEQH